MPGLKIYKFVTIGGGLFLKVISSAACYVLDMELKQKVDDCSWVNILLFFGGLVLEKSLYLFLFVFLDVSMLRCRALGMSFPIFMLDMLFT